VQEISATCMYGKNCGSTCNLVDPVGIDDLDRSCYLHDCCLSMSRTGTYTLSHTMNRLSPIIKYFAYIGIFHAVSTGPLGNAACYCEQELIRNAQSIIDNERKCAWWNIFCFDTEKVQAAKSIRAAMQLRLLGLQASGDCGSTPSTYTNFAGDVCPSSQPITTPDASPSPTPIQKPTPKPSQKPTVTPKPKPKPLWKIFGN